MHPKYFSNIHLFSCQSSPTHLSHHRGSTGCKIWASISTSRAEETRLLVSHSWRTPPLAPPRSRLKQGFKIWLQLYDWMKPWTNHSSCFHLSVCGHLSNSGCMNDKHLKGFHICRSVQCVWISFSLALPTWFKDP